MPIVQISKLVWIRKKGSPLSDYKYRFLCVQK